MKRGGTIRLLVWPALAAGALWAALVCLKTRGLLPEWATWTHVHLTPLVAWPVLIALAAAFGLGGFRYSLRTLAAFLLFATCAEALGLHWEPWWLAESLDDCRSDMSADGQRFFVRDEQDTLWLWDAVKCRCIAKLGSGVCRPGFSRDGKHIAAGVEDGTVRVWNSQDGRCVATLTGHLKPIEWADFSPDGLKVVTGGPDNTLRIWSVESSKCLQVLKTPWGCKFTYAARLSPDGKKLLASNMHSAILWDLEKGSEIARLNTNEEMPYLIESSFLLNGQRVITCYENHDPRIWNADDGTLVIRVEGHGGPATSVDISPDERHVATAIGESALRHEIGAFIENENVATTRIWDSETGECIKEMKGHTGPVCVRYSADGTRLLTWPAISPLLTESTYLPNKDARIWNSKSGECLAVLRSAEFPISLVEFSSDGTRVVTATCSGSKARLASDKDWPLRANTVNVWDAATGKCIATMRGHTEAMAHVGFGPGSGRVTSSSERDATLRIWDEATGRMLACLPLKNRPSTWLTNSAVFLRYDDGSMQIWRRRRPEWWWGVFYLKEFWATVFFAAFFVWSIRRDRRYFGRLDAEYAAALAAKAAAKAQGSPEGPAPPP